MENDPVLKSEDQKIENNNDEKIEHIADLIGSWGPFQRKLFIILTIVYSISPFSNSSTNFYVTKSDFYCVSQNSTPVKS